MIDSLVAHAKSSYPKECCGIVAEKELNNVKYYPCNNIATNQEDFILDPKDYLKYVDYNILAIFHSHPDASSTPSRADIDCCNRGDVPWIILGYPQMDMTTIYPNKEKLPYLGRRFLHGVVDCLTLVIDYYSRELNISITNYYREDDWWDKGQSMYLDLHEREGFSLYTDIEPRIHDIVLMCIKSDVPNHAAIYLGNGVILHHLPNRLSTRESLAKWGSKIYGYLRYD